MMGRMRGKLRMPRMGKILRRGDGEDGKNVQELEDI